MIFISQLQELLNQVKGSKLPTIWTWLFTYTIVDRLETLVRWRLVDAAEREVTI